MRIKEAMFLFGIGYKDLDPVRSIKEKEWSFTFELKKVNSILI